MAIHYYDHYAQTANQLLAHLAEEIGEAQNLKRAERILKVVLHTLRDQLPLEESFQFMAQLPLFLKGLYVSEWKAHQHTQRVRHVDEFIGRMMLKDPAGKEDFVNTDKARFLIQKVFKVLGTYVSEGEWKDIMATVSSELHPLIEPALKPTPTQ